MSAAIFDVKQYAQFSDAGKNEKEYVKFLSGTLGQACGGEASAGGSAAEMARIAKLEKANADLTKLVHELASRVAQLETQVKSGGAAPSSNPAAPKKVDVKGDDEDDDDVDLFGSDDEETDAAAEKLREERLQAYAAKKSKKPALIAKSNIILDVKPWDDETDMKEVERLVRTIVADGLLWGTSKLVPLAYGIKKLTISCVVEDDKIGTDFLEEEITKFEDHIQSVDVAAFNKI